MQNYILNILTEDQAKEICRWRYEEEYAIYNFSDWNVVVESKWNLSIKEKRESEFISVLIDNELVAYGRISTKENKVFIGIGLKPQYCGKGLGKDIMKLLVMEGKRRFPNYVIALEVRSFNIRAVNCYKSEGFEIKEKYMQKTFNGDIDEFYYMEYEG